jgi:hypothetical protein
MSRQDHYAANCDNCIFFDAEHGCNNGISWLNGPVPKNAECHTPILYRHPDGECVIYFEAEKNRLVVENETSGEFVAVPIAKDGLVAFAHALLGVAVKESGHD